MEVNGQTVLIIILDSVFQEGANINKSLTTLGKVISALAEVVSTALTYLKQLFHSKQNRDSKTMEYSRIIHDS